MIIILGFATISKEDLNLGECTSFKSCLLGLKGVRQFDLRAGSLKIASVGDICPLKLLYLFDCFTEFLYSWMADSWRSCPVKEPFLSFLANLGL